MGRNMREVVVVMVRGGMGMKAGGSDDVIVARRRTATTA